MRTMRVIVIGAGITGLTTALTLRDEARRLGGRLDLRVIEREPQAGGHARTIAADGFLVEAGPNGFLNREPETLALIEALGLGSRVVTANAASARRFILRDGRLCQVPDGPGALLRTPALSWRGKLRLLAEPWAAGPPGTDETVHAFAARRIGAEAADVLVDTAVSGISAGDSRRLSVAAQFPMMVEMEREHGGLFRAMFARRRSGLGPSRLLSFDGGMGVLPRAMVTALGDAVSTGVAVASVERRNGAWRLRLDDGASLDADCLVCATPARVTNRLVRGLDPELAAALDEVAYAGVAVAALGYRVSDVPRALDGYGYLVTRGEGLSTLGVVWESSLFPGRAPDGHALFRAILGGSRVPGLANLSEAEILGLARAELGQVMGVRAAPVHASIVRWPQAIAQYTVGHLHRMDRLRTIARAYPGLHVCGTSYDGVSFNHAVKRGRQTARQVIGQLWGTSPSDRQGGSERRDQGAQQNRSERRDLPGSSRVESHSAVPGVRS